MKNILLFSSMLAITSLGVFKIPATSSTPSTSAIAVDSGGNDRNVLTTGGWKIKSIISNKPCDTDGDGYHTTNIASEMPACALDDIMYIKPNGKVVFKRYERCSSFEKAVEEYNWKLTGDDKFIISREGIEAEMYFKYVTPDELVLVIPSEAMGEMYYFTTTYERPIRP